MRPYHELDVYLTWGIVLGGGGGSNSGAGNGYHSGTDIGCQQPLPADRAAIAYMQAAIAAFVREPRGGLRKFGWPEYKPDSMTFLLCSFSCLFSFSYLRSTLSSFFIPFFNVPANYLLVVEYALYSLSYFRFGCVLVPSGTYLFPTILVHGEISVLV